MLKTLKIAIAALCLAPAATSAAPLWGAERSTVYVASTHFTGHPEDQALCATFDDTYRLFTPVQRSFAGYTLSNDGCATTTGMMMTPLALEHLKSAGLLPAHVPTTFSAPITWSFGTKIGVALFFLLPLWAAWGLSPRRKAIRRKTVLSQNPAYFDTLLSVMFHIARQDGVIEREELQNILDVYKDLTGENLAPEVIASKFSQLTTDEKIISLADGYSGIEAETVLDAAILVAGFGTAVTREKTALLYRLNDVLERKSGWFSAPAQPATSRFQQIA